MHPDVEKLISIAKDSGELTGKQREIILRKARQLGEDVDEVEMVLESIRPKMIIEGSTRASEKRMKCPNCGALITETSFKCPECGYVLQHENKASEEARSVVDRLQERLAESSKPANKTDSILASISPKIAIQRQVSVVNTFTMPTTKEGLTQLLEFAYSNYISIGNGFEDMHLKPLKNAWYGKTIQAYNSLARIGGNDTEIKSLLEKYSSLISTEKKKLSGLAKFWIWWLVGMSILAGLICLGIHGESSAKDQVGVCLQNNDFVGARAAARKAGGPVDNYMDDISVQEVSYLISIGNIKHAKVVAAGIGDDQKRYNVLKAISDVEFDKGNSQLLQPNVDHNPVLDTPHVDKNQENNTLNSEENNQLNTEEMVSDNMADSTTPAGLDNVTSTSETMPDQKNETVTKGSVSVTAPNWVQVGEQFSVAFSFEDKVSDFEFTNPDGILLVWGPQKSTSTSSVEGNSVTVTTYTFVLSAQAPGIYSLPAKAKSHDHDVQFPKISVEVVK